MTRFTALKCFAGAVLCIICSEQQEWQYLQRRTPNIELCFDWLEKAIQEEFLPALFGGAIDDGDYWLELVVKYSRLALPNTANSALRITKLVKMSAAISSAHWKMRQPLRPLSIPNYGRSKSTNPNVQRYPACSGSQAHHRSNISRNQTHHSQRLRNRQVAANDTSMELASFT